MAVSHKYRTFDQLLEDVTVDFRTMLRVWEPQQLLKLLLELTWFG